MLEPGEREAVIEVGLDRGRPATPPAADAAQEPPSLRRNRDFQVFLGGQGLSSLGDSITFTALPILVLALTGSGLQMGIVGILQSLPDLLLGLPAGAIADRVDRRRLMLSADLGRAALTAAIPVTALLGGPTMAAILLVTFPINCLRVLWLGGYAAAVAGLVGRPQVGRAQSILEATFNLGFVLGPAIAGVLSATIGPAATIGLDAASFVVSAGALFLVRTSLRPPERATATHLLADIAEGIRFVVGHPILRSVILFWGLEAVGTAAIPLALTYHIETDRQLGSSVLGLVLSAYGVGSLIGALAAGRIRVVGRNLLLGAFVTGLLLFVIVSRPPVPVVAAASFLAGVAQSIVLIGYITLRTTLTPDALLGRVGSTARLISIGLTPIGLFLAGLLIDATDGGTAIGAMATWMIVLAVGFALSATVRSARPPVAVAEVQRG